MNIVFATSLTPNTIHGYGDSQQSFSIKVFFTFTEEIANGKRHFCAVSAKLA